MAVVRGFLLAIALAIPTIAGAQPTPTPAPPPVEPDDAPPDVPDVQPQDDPKAFAMAVELAALRARLEALEARDRPVPVRDDEVPPTAPVEDWRDAYTGFKFGSYGRVIAGTDLRGGKPVPVHVAAHGPRIVEASYLELDFAYGIPYGKHGLVRTVITLAYDDQLFHDSGEFTAGPAIRNLYAEARDGKLALWVGSRMYRGDDLYLLDFWPLDDLNTLGGGARYETGALTVAAHVGVNRLLDPFQYQERDVADPELGATTVVQLNRQRMIGSAKVEYVRAPAGAEWHQRARLYAEVHGLPAGERRRTDATLEVLPRDYGTTLGFELSGWQPGDAGRSRHANLFVRWSKGLAAFDELAAPTSFDNELRTFANASELVVGLGANWDVGQSPDDRPTAHVTFATYARRFIDADRQDVDRDDGWEYVADVRPAYALRPHLFAAIDLAYEVRFPRGLQPTTQKAADPAIVSIAPMLTYSPAGSSAFARPQLRLVYRAAHQNEGALALYPAADRRARTWTHFLGLQAEWWFNSNSYR